MKLFELFGKLTFNSDHVGQGWDPDLHDVIILEKSRNSLMGFILDETALLVCCERYQSFRIRRGNLGFVRGLKIAKSVVPIDKAFLRLYFQENEDNPYAIQYAMSLVARGEPLDGLTQLPPLWLNRNSAAYEKRLEWMIRRANPGDLVFSRPLRSPVSSFIRKQDHSPFSHVGTYLGEGCTMDVTPVGMQRTDMRSEVETTHFALYGFKQPPSDEQRRKAVEFILKLERTVVGFNYLGVIDLWLRKRLGRRPHPRRPSVSDLLFSGQLQLMGYA